MCWNCLGRNFLKTVKKIRQELKKDRKQNQVQNVKNQAVKQQALVETRAPPPYRARQCFAVIDGQFPVYQFQEEINVEDEKARKDKIGGNKSRV